MHSITVAISKGGVGKTLLLANVGASLASRGSKVVLVDTTETMHLSRLLGVNNRNVKVTLEHVVKRSLVLDESVYPTRFPGLHLIPSGITLKDFLELNPFKFAEKLSSVDCDFLFIDVPYATVGRAALLSLGFCQYYILGPLDQTQGMTLCIEEGLNTIDLAALLKTVPLGFVINKVKEPDKLTNEYLKDLEQLFQMKCLAVIHYIQKMEEAFEKSPFLPLEKNPESEFTRKTESIADFLQRGMPRTLKTDAAEFLHTFIREKR